jgi:hypothetical protein
LPQIGVAYGAHGAHGYLTAVQGSTETLQVRAPGPGRSWHVMVGGRRSHAAFRAGVLTFTLSAPAGRRTDWSISEKP